MVRSTTTRQFCLETSEICEVNARRGTINGKEINDCEAFCNEHGLRCLNAYEDKTLAYCTRDTSKTRKCNDDFTREPLHIGFADMICSCGKIAGTEF